MIFKRKNNLLNLASPCMAASLIKRLMLLIQKKAIFIKYHLNIKIMQTLNIYFYKTKKQ